ncbi:translocation protein SEC63 [Nematocida minor]|uniref:translocation protein SEC63 n=1 Tax=Nematocida minor TaxID=1912983 RepID=UPI0022203A74|nr:translocation protein SEC63 [Nematocida minor]KAI5192747.1 translocation protein SEC63 [Nematocida minor]
MESHGYDATGLSSSLLAAGLLIPSIVTLYFVSKTKKEKTVCKCGQCARLTKKTKIDKYRVLMYAFLLLLALPVYNIVFKEYNKNTLSNPYKLLEISTSATDKEIEGAYRKAIRKTKLMKTSTAEKKKSVQNILKAKDLLLDPKARERWDTFGDAPMVNNHTIAIPSWIMSKYNPLLLIFLYVLVLGVLLPKGVSYMWMYSFEYSSSGILYKSTESLYRALKHTYVTDPIGLLVLLNKYTVELSQYKPKTEEKKIQQIKEIISTDYAIPISLSAPTFILSLGMLLLRDDSVLSLIDRSDIEYMQSEIVLCIGAIKSLSIAFKSSSLYYLAFDLERCITQSIPYPKYHRMQTGASFEETFLSLHDKENKESEKEEKSKEENGMFKIKIAGIDIYNPIDGVIAKNGSLVGTVDTIVKVSVFRENSKSVYTPVSINNDSEKKNDVGDLSELEGSSEEIYPSALNKYPISIKGSSSEPVHAPVYFEDISYDWVCTLEVNNEILMESPAFTPSATGCEIFFKIPPMANIISSRRAEISVKISNGKYFERDTSMKTVILIK